MSSPFRSRMLLFGGLYFAQGVPWGFVSVALALRLTSLGFSPAALGDLMFVALLPWTAKPILGPLVDHASFGRLGRRRPLILATEVGMTLSLLAMSFVDPLNQRWSFSALLFLHNLFASTQDVGTDALAIDLLAPDERGRANGIMAAAKFAGVVLGGQGLLWVASHGGWPVAYGCTIALLLLPAALVIRVQEPPLPVRQTHLIGLAVRVFSTRLALLAAGFALLVNLTDAFLFPLTYPLFRNRLGFSEQEVATLATLGNVVGALGALAGGALADRLGCRRTLVMASLGSAGISLAFVTCKSLWGHYPVLLAYTILSGVTTGVIYAATLALFMNLTDPRIGATQFQLYMALLNLKDAGAQKVGGRLAESFSPSGMFGLAALLEILPLVLLRWLGQRKAGDTTATEPAPISNTPV